MAGELEKSRQLGSGAERVLTVADLEGGCYDAGTRKILNQMYLDLAAVLNGGRSNDGVLFLWKARLMTSRMPKPPDGRANFDTVGFTVRVNEEAENFRKAVETVLGHGPNVQTNDGVLFYHIGLHQPGVAMVASLC